MLSFESNLPGVKEQPVLESAICLQERPIFARRKMGGLRIQRDRQVGNLRDLVSRRARPMANFIGRRRAAPVAGRWQRVVLPFFRRQDDGSAGYDGSSFRCRHVRHTFSDHARQPVLVYDLFVYDVSRDGQRFLINTQVKQAESVPMSVVLNWPANLNR